MADAQGAIENTSALGAGGAAASSLERTLSLARRDVGWIKVTFAPSGDAH